MIGICKLCRMESGLLNSHLLAAGFYKLLRNPDADNQNPIQIDEKVTTFTSDQVRKHLLCADCEDRFNRNGERWVLKNCYRGEHGFALCAALRISEPVVSREKLQVYAAGKIKGIEV